MISETTARNIEHENERLEGKLDRIKQTERSTTQKALCILGAAVIGGGYGYLNAKEGGTAATPYSLGGSVPLDTALALLGAVGMLVVKPSKPEGAFVDGLGAGAIALYTSRLGAAYESGATTTPAATTPTTSGPIRQMSQRFMDSGAYGVRANPWNNPNMVGARVGY